MRTARRFWRTNSATRNARPAPRRLIERGAILEGIFPLAPDLPGVEVKAFLIALSHLPGAAELAAKLPKSGGQAVSPLFTRAHYPRYSTIRGNFQIVAIYKDFKEISSDNLSLHDTVKVTKENRRL